MTNLMAAQGSVQTESSAKVFRNLYARWQNTNPCMVNLIPMLHRDPMVILWCPYGRIDMTQQTYMAIWSISWSLGG
jgi:hypothetical protein